MIYMETISQNFWIQFGALGTMVTILITMVIVLYKDLKSERKYRSQELEKRHNQMIEMQEKMNTAINNNTQVMKAVLAHERIKSRD